MQNRKPAWWQLFLIVPVMLGLSLLEARHPVPGIAPELADMLLVLLSFSAMLAWVQTNLSVIEHEEIDKYKLQHNLKVTVYEPETARTEESNNLEVWQPMLSNDEPSRLPVAAFMKKEDENLWRPS